MKKFVFCALALVAFSGMSFAGNGKKRVEPVKKVIVAKMKARETCLGTLIRTFDQCLEANPTRGRLCNTIAGAAYNACKAAESQP